MITKNYPPTKTWILVHVIFPMLPFFIEGFARLIVLDSSLEIVSFSTLAASMGLLCLFVNQNLLAHSIPLSDDDEQDKLIEVTAIFLALGITNFFLFACIVFLTANPDIPKKLYLVKSFIFICAFISIREAYRTQQSYKLRAQI